MQASLRAAVGELTRGLSTGIVLLSANHCQACSCQGPSINFACPACADCVCSGRVLRADVSDGGGRQYFWAFASVFLLGFLLGGIVCTLAWSRFRSDLGSPPYAVRGLGAIVSARP